MKQISSLLRLPDDTILEYIENGYDIQQIARAMCSDINLIALKVDTLIAQGYQLRNRNTKTIFLNTVKKYKTVKSRMRSDGLIFISFYYIRIVLCKGYLSTIFHDSVVIIIHSCVIVF